MCVCVSSRDGGVGLKASAHVCVRACLRVCVVSCVRKWHIMLAVGGSAGEARWPAGGDPEPQQ